MFDVILDLRPESAAYCLWTSAILTAQNHTSLYIPEGVAHGFQTLSDNSEVLYQMSEFFYSDATTGVRWNDSAFGIEWPLDDRTISVRDQHYPDYVR